MIAIAGVMVLAGAGLAIAVLSAISARHPDRAAMLVVLAVAGGGFGLFLVGVMGLLGVGAPGAPATPQAAVVSVSKPRLILGLGTAVVLLGVAGRLIRTGDWRRPDFQSPSAARVADRSDRRGPL